MADNPENGDTIRVTLDGESTPVRFLGIDAPETVANNACGGDDEIALGEAATAALEGMNRPRGLGW